MIKTALVVFGVILIGWSGYTVGYEGRLETPQYTIVKKIDGMEIREYSPFRVAQTQTSQGQKGLYQGFRLVAGYIFGGNQEEKSMAMTAPVIQENNDTKMNVAFFMSKAETNLPMPNDRNVIVKEKEWGAIAALSFYGSGSQERFLAKEKMLREKLKKQGVKGKPHAIYAQYNSPSAFPLLRKNEVLIQLME